jgi:hypothetical protein
MTGWLGGRVVLAAWALAIGVGLSLAGQALAHSWYPPQCCNEQDCRKVDRIEHLPDGTMLLHTGMLVVQVPRGFKEMPSKDADAHVCFYRNYMGRYVPRCVFMPAMT